MNYYAMLPSYLPVYILSLWWIREAAGLIHHIPFFHKSKSNNSTKINLLLLLLTLTGGLLLSEIACAFFIDQSDSQNVSFVSRQWFNRHWKPINSKGFRSREKQTDIKDKKHILVLGDSFAAGHGIENYQDTFPEILASRLENSYYVSNYSKCGWDTAEELHALQDIEFSPEIIILSYFPNDIVSVANRMGFNFDWQYITPQNPLWTWLVNNSYFANYLHFSTTLGVRNKETYSQFIAYLLECHQNPQIGQEHQNELRTIAKICSDKGARLVVVSWPLFSLPRESALMNKYLEDALKDFSCEIIVMEKEIGDWPLEKLIVSNKDPHPSKTVHMFTADLLEQQISKY